MSTDDKKSIPLALARRQRELLGEVLKTTGQITVDALLDTLAALYAECVKLDSKQGNIQSFVQRYKGSLDRLSSLRVSIKDFKTVKLLGRGAFGEVALSQCKLDDQFYAIKKLQKSEMINRQEAFFMEERELLGLANGQWITSLEFAFQDDEYLYLVMEYLAGGNLLNQLYKHNNFEESTARFYAAEAVLGIDEIHQMGFAYRDLKPDNMLLNHDGHLKLADFGSCIKLDENGHITSKVAVGTPYYIAPEVLQAQEGRGGKNGVESDWWSLGVVLYEMLIGDPPFFSESNMETYNMVMNYKTSLQFPDDIELTSEAVDLIKKLICDRSTRLNVRGIKSHPFFKDVDWENIRKATPPFVPELKGPDDTSNFDDDFDETDETPTVTLSKKGITKREFTGDAMPFIGYSFVRNGLKLALVDENDTSPNGTAGASAAVAASSASNAAELKKLQHEIDNLHFMYKEEKQQVAQLEELRAGLMSEIDKKDRALQQEVDAHKGTANERLELQKSTKIIQLEVLEIQRKLKDEQAEKQSHGERIKDLETQLTQAIKAREDLAKSFAASAGDKDSTSAEISSLKRKLEEEHHAVKAAEERIAELQSAKEDLAAKLQAANDSTATEKTERNKLDIQLREMKKTLVEASAKESKLTVSLDQRQAEIAELKKELASLKQALEDEASSKTALQQSKVDLENAQKMLQLEIEQLKERVVREEKKSASLAEQVKASEEATTATQNGVVSQQEVESLRYKLAEENQSKEAIQQKLAEAERSKQSLTLQLATIEAKLKEEAASNASMREKLGKVQKSLDILNATRSIDEQDRIEMEGQLNTALAELEAFQKQDIEQKAVIQTTEAKLGDAEKARESAEAKLAALKKKHDEEARLQHSQSEGVEEIKALLAKERNTMLVLLSDKEAADAAKETALRESEKLKKKLDEALQEKKEHDEELAELKKSNAVLELERNQFEKKLEEETKTRTALDDKLTDIALENVKITTSRDDLEEKLQASQSSAESQVAAVQAKLDAKEEAYRELETAHEELKKAHEKTQANLRGAIEKFGTLSPASAGPDGKDKSQDKKYRKLKDEYGTLQMQYKALEEERKSLQAQLAEPRLSAVLASETKLNRNPSTMSQHSGGTNDTASSTTPPNDTSIFGFLKRRNTKTVREGTVRPRPMSMLISTSPKPAPIDVNLTGIEGSLKIPKEKGIRQGFNKKYIVVRDSRMLMYEDKTKVFGDGVILCDIRSQVFVIRDPLPDMVAGLNAKEAVSMFVIYVKDGRTNSTPPTPTSSKALPAALFDAAAIAAKIKGIEKDIQVEDNILKVSTALIKAPSSSSSQKKLAQKNFDGSQLRLQELRKDLARWKGLEAGSESSTAAAAAPFPSTTSAADGKLEALQTKITAKESFKSATEALLSMASNETKRQGYQLQVDHANAELEQLRNEMFSLKNPSDSGVLLRSDVSISTIASGESTHEHNGHRFYHVKFNTPVHCQVCSQQMFGNHSFECETCKFTAHSHCYALPGPTCRDIQTLKDIKPLIFLASDEGERDRWVSQLMLIRDAVNQPPTMDIDAIGNKSPVVVAA